MMAKKRKAVKKKTSRKSQTDTIEKYYSEEKRKIAGNLKRLEIKKARSFLNLEKRETVRLLQSKRRLDLLYKDINSHIEKVNKRVSRLKSKKSAESTVLKKIKELSNAVKRLEKEAKRIELDVRKVVQVEKAIVSDVLGKKLTAFDKTDYQNRRRCLCH